MEVGKGWEKDGGGGVVCDGFSKFGFDRGMFTKARK